jgi:hypothetical protein
VNGDGYVNDRAFLFDPATANQPAVASGMKELLENGSGAARECLRRQLGNLAGRNSCEGPWMSTANLSFTFNPMRVRMPQRATLSFNLSNPLGAADLLLHGSSSLHGWGQPASPDQSLLYVRGFDASSGRYLYEVNQRFGATLPALSAFRLPVTLTAMLRFDVGPTRERQSLTMQLDRGRRTDGQKMPEQFLRLMYGTGGFPNPMAQILRQQDSLHLTSQQADSIASLNRWYSVRVDSIWTPVAKYLSDLPSQYDQGAAYDRYLSARRASVDLLVGAAAEAAAVHCRLSRAALSRVDPLGHGRLHGRSDAPRHCRRSHGRRRRIRRWRRRWRDAGDHLAPMISAKHPECFCSFPHTSTSHDSLHSTFDSSHRHRGRRAAAAGDSAVAGGRGEELRAMEQHHWRARAAGWTRARQRHRRAEGRAPRLDARADHHRR